ncbi:helix-turn-helix domain-containing protein [Aeromonas sp. NJAU223]|uniref:helix-turn-helix domain-containing protein n=1 Tax=Aeromonas sp. NJAU223 TaxID=3115650 RepID=UPI003DA80339
MNACSGGHFYDWINRYRVEEAKRLLQGSEETVASICYQAGFNSKSTFNTAFRRHTGLTPSAFRRQAPSDALGAAS